MSVFERYFIENIEIGRHLGQFQNGIYKPTFGIEPNFLKRRSNFHNITITALTEPYPLVDIINLEKSPFDPHLDRYDVTKTLQGISKVILQNMEESLNFTAQIYKREHL